MKRFVLTAATALAFAFATGAWSFWGGGSAPETPPASSGKTVPDATQKASPADDPLQYRRLLIQDSRDVAEACLVFSAPLDASGSVDYGSYFDVGMRVTWRVESSRLCLSGFSFGKVYTVTLRPGLPDATGQKLAEETPVTVDFGDRPASVSFGSGFVLPREVADGLPVTTINIDALDVRILRVGDRLLSQMPSAIIDERRASPYYAQDYEQEAGQLVWKATIPITGPRNATVSSLIPLDVVAKYPEPGAYVVLANDANSSCFYCGSLAMQWMVQSDLGLTSFQGENGLMVAVRSLKSAKPLPQVRLTLVARNNNELAAVTTDNDGKAWFDPGTLRGTGGMTPVMIMAYASDGDFVFLDLRRPAFDLSDRGAGGRALSGPVDAFMYTDRGIYRPGETVHIVTLLRNSTAHALAGRTSTLRIRRPDGKEFRSFTLTGQEDGSLYLALELPPSAPRGLWEAEALIDPKAPPVRRISFDVQDFVPQRLGLTIGDHPTLLTPGEALNLPLEARFLYGAPASGLKAEAKATLEADPAPFPEHDGFRWGLADERFERSSLSLEIAATDEKGQTQAVGLIPHDLASTLPLRAAVSLSVQEPGGRTTSEQLAVPLRIGPVFIGIRPQFEDRVAEGQEARFDVVAVDAAGRRIGVKGLRYQIFKDRSTWQWFRKGEDWTYERIPREVEIASGTLDAPADALAVFRRVVPWGRYRLVLRDPASKAATSATFSSGWYGEASAERPDRLKIAADQESYAPGSKARLHIESELAGEALVVVANERVFETLAVSVPAGGADFSVQVRPEWGAGAYALVSLYRPLTAESGHAPIRSVGAAWLGIDSAPRTLKVVIDAPKQIAPRQTLTIPVMIAGGQNAHVTLAAVDQGILQLTRFKTPAPSEHYFSKRRLGLDMRDDYGRLIRGDGAQDQDQGGDSFGGDSLSVVPTRTVALFSGLVKADKSGKAVISLDIPDFQGELRLMAAAFDNSRVGSAEARLTVRDPLVADMILPRFLAPGDKASATVLLHNIEGAPGDYRIAVTTRDAVSGGEKERIASLPAGRREEFSIPLEALSPGIGTVSLSVRGPKAFAAERSWPIQVRTAQLPETRESVRMLNAGEEVVLDSFILEGLTPGTASAAVSLSRWQKLDVPGLLRWLDRYPFGCLEQTVSRALPLLHFNDMALLAGSRQDQTIDSRVQDAIDRIQTMQTPSGNFSMWSGPNSSSADAWISVFALDFLNRASEKGFDVSPSALDSGQRWLKSAATGRRSDVGAYALSLLARNGQANLSDLRYLHDSKKPATALPLAHLGAALEAAGERGRASAAFDDALSAFNKEARASKKSRYLREDALPYGSTLRDAYAVAVNLAASGRSAQIPAVLDMVSAYDKQAENTTTQEKAWMLLAAAEMSKNAGRLAATIDGQVVDAGDPILFSPKDDDLARGVRLVNTGSGPIFQTTSVEGVPEHPLPALGKSMTLSMSVHTLDGRPALLDAVQRNDRFAIILEGGPEQERQGDYAILNLLPAGWEIETVLNPWNPGLSWIAPLSDLSVQEARDDRYAASVRLPVRSVARGEDGQYSDRYLESDTYRFRIGYIVRAVTPGTFVLPAAVAEHMYDPALKARTSMGMLQVKE